MEKIQGILQKIQSQPAKSQLVWIVILNGSIYGLFSFLFPLTRYYDTSPPVDYTKLTNFSAPGFIGYLLGIGLLFWLYFQAFHTCLPVKSSEVENQGRLVRVIFIGGILFSALLIFSYPLTAIDLFVYALRSRGWALYGLMPMTTSPNMFPNSDPWLALAGEWMDAASPYGPIWEWLSLGGFNLVGGNYLIQLIALKIFGALAYLGCGWLVYKILKDIQPDWASAGTLAFAWNPLVLFESVQNAHNDMLMMFLFLAATQLVLKLNTKKITNHIWLWGITACLLFALSVLVKWVTFLVFPLFLLALSRAYQRRIRAGILYALTTIVAIVAGMLPVWPGMENWAALNSGAGRSLTALLVLSLRDTLGTNRAFDVTQSVIYAIIGVVYLGYLWRTIQYVWFRKRFQNYQEGLLLPFAGAFYVFFTYVLIGVPTFHAWYLLWFIPLAPLLFPDQRAVYAAGVFSATALFIIPYFETVRVWIPILNQNQILGHAIGVPLLILPQIITIIRLNRRSIESG